MKKKIVILGSTGSIGKDTLKILRKDKKNFSIELLSTNTKIKEVIQQAKEFNVKNVIISDYKKFLLAKEKNKKTNIKFYNSFSNLNKILKNKKIFYTMISIVGLNGLEPSLKMIKHTKTIAIANKESIICGWNLIMKELKKYKTKFIPVDSEHFSIYSLINKNSVIEKLFITASGGPLLNYSKSRLSKVNLKDVLKHPNWKMGKKITVDSSTMMNKVFEVIEAKNIFDLTYEKISILIHSTSYVHAIVKLENGLTKLLIHEPDMKIPIHNSIYSDNHKSFKSKRIKINLLNSLNFRTNIQKKFPLINILENLPEKSSLYETALVSINDYFVDKFIKNKIKYNDLIKLILKFSSKKIFTKFKEKTPKNINHIHQIRNYVSLKLNSLGI